MAVACLRLEVAYRSARLDDGETVRVNRAFDALTMYGGDSLEPGTANRQTFPVNAFSMERFTRLGRSVSNTNTWAMEIHPGRMFAYELSRPGRLFRVEFDLTAAVSPPPAPWGHQAP